VNRRIFTNVVLLGYYKTCIICNIIFIKK
jgi:hypothetical protein